MSFRVRIAISQLSGDVGRRALRMAAAAHSQGLPFEARTGVMKVFKLHPWPSYASEEEAKTGNARSGDPRRNDTVAAGGYIRDVPIELARELAPHAIHPHWAHQGWLGQGASVWHETGVSFVPCIEYTFPYPPSAPFRRIAQAFPPQAKTRPKTKVPKIPVGTAECDDVRVFYRFPDSTLVLSLWREDMGEHAGATRGEDGLPEDYYTTLKRWRIERHARDGRILKVWWPGQPLKTAWRMAAELEARRAEKGQEWGPGANPADYQDIVDRYRKGK